MYFLIHMLTPDSIACCSVIYCFTDDEDDSGWNCCHPQGLLVPSSNVNQPKANSTQEGVKSIVAQTGKTLKRKPMNGQIYWGADSCPSITFHTKSRKACVSTQGRLSLSAVLVAIAISSIFRIAGRIGTSIIDTWYITLKHTQTLYISHLHRSLLTTLKTIFCAQNLVGGKDQHFWNWNCILFSHPI
jgi:hypothetical protein